MSNNPQPPPLTDEERTKWRKLAEQATAGTWHWDGRTIIWSDLPDGTTTPAVELCDEWDGDPFPNLAANAAFIAAARTALPALDAEVTRIRAELADRDEQAKLNAEEHLDTLRLLADVRKELKQARAEVERLEAVVQSDPVTSLRALRIKPR